MVFGRIDYINLLPFYMFLKRYHNHLLKFGSTKKGPPSAINRLYKKRLVDAGFISSIKSRHQKATNLGIIARGAVTSVLVIEGKEAKDSESDTSNALAKVLGIKGQVTIGDKALRTFLSGVKTIDLAKKWQEKHNLPFVFARLCYTASDQQIKRIEKQFLRYKSRRIPQMILEAKSKQSKISKKEIINYLQRIDYHIDKKAEMALKKFLFITQQRGIK